MFTNTTARVDIQRLQILNDRLCQTLDALNQVRMSAHNISYSPYAQGPGQWSTVAGFNTLGGYNTHLPFFGGYSYGIPQTVAPFSHGINSWGMGMTPAVRPSYGPAFNGGFGMTEGFHSPLFAHAAQPVAY